MLDQKLRVVVEGRPLGLGQTLQLVLVAGQAAEHLLVGNDADLHLPHLRLEAEGSMACPKARPRSPRRKTPAGPP
eukprot:7435321-Pyramimonas_sp.AAC.1